MQEKQKHNKYKMVAIGTAAIITLVFLFFLITPPPISGYWWVTTKNQQNKGCGNCVPYLIYTFSKNNSKMYQVWKNKNDELYISDEQDVSGGSTMKKKGRQYVFIHPYADLGEFVITPGWLYADFADVKKNSKNNPHWRAKRLLNPFIINKLLKEWKSKKEKNKTYQIESPNSDTAAAESE